MPQILTVAGVWLGIMALIGIALLLTKKIADFITAARNKNPKSQNISGGEFRNPYYISEEEAAAIKEQTERFNKNSD